MWDKLKFLNKENLPVFSSLQKVEDKKSSRRLGKTLLIMILAIIAFGFLPWSQNIRTNGKITTYLPEQRPQTVHSIIPGRIEKWFVREGQAVSKGDTIAFVSEIKVEYMDTSLLDRTEKQISFKKESITSYEEKMAAQQGQLAALKVQNELKLDQIKLKNEQLKLKRKSDSIAYEAAKNEKEIAAYQLDRADSLLKLGLKSLVDVEKRRVKFQNSQSYELSALNKWLSTKNDIIQNEIAYQNIKADFREKQAKLQSDMMSTNSLIFNSDVDINKLENTYSNYKTRNQYYFILAPQDGFITQTFVNGIGEIIKEGQKLVSIMPKEYDLVVEMYVDPIDYPLIHKGEMVQVQFDGWPAIVFTGWPGASYGTYSGEIYAIDQFISSNGKYRVLVKPDESDHAWPKALRYGAGARSMVILNDVAIWYELWRNINGFPPEFYQPKESGNYEYEK